VRKLESPARGVFYLAKPFSMISLVKKVRSAF